MQTVGARLFLHVTPLSSFDAFNGVHSIEIIYVFPLLRYASLFLSQFLEALRNNTLVALALTKIQ